MQYKDLILKFRDIKIKFKTKINYEIYKLCLKK